MLIRDPNLLPRILYAIGAAFLLINLQVFYQYVRFRRIQATALLTRGAPRPPLYPLFLWVGAVLAALVFYKPPVLRLHPKYVFVQPVMLRYYVSARPLGR